MTTNNSVNVGLSGVTGTGNFVGSNAPTISGTTTFPGSTTIDSSGNVNVGSGQSIVLNNATSSYSAANLNYYEEYSSTFSVSGAWSASGLTIRIYRIGKIVTLFYQGTSTGSASAANLVAPNSTIPPRFLPSTIFPSLIVYGKNNGTSQPLTLDIGASGQLTWYNTNGNPFTSSAAANIATSSVTWSI